MRKKSWTKNRGRFEKKNELVRRGKNRVFQQEREGAWKKNGGRFFERKKHMAG